MQKSFYRKKIICLAACAAAIFSLTSCGNSNDNVMFGVLNELGASQESAEAANSVSSPTTAGSEESRTTTAEPTDEAGGNPGDSSCFTIEITVMENKYIYGNREISYNELLELFDTLTANDVVRFRDENAALDTYQQAVSALDEREIPYIHAAQE